MTRLLVRTDGSREIGLGHVGRCLAVAEAASDRGLEVQFVLGAASGRQGPAQQLIVRHDFTWSLADEDADPTWLTEGPPALILVDGYHLDHVVGRAREAGHWTAAIVDDLGGAPPADVVCCPTPTAPGESDGPAGSVLLTGPRHALIRKAILARRDSRALRPRLDHLLVTFGGSDPTGMGPHVVQRLPGRDGDLRTTLLVGPAAGPVPDLPAGVEVVRDPDDVGALLADSDAAISAAGSMTWELLCLGIPVALVQVAENQQYVGPTVAAAGAGIFLGAGEEAVAGLPDALAALDDPDRRQGFHDRARALVDGRGAARLVDALLAAADRDVRAP